MKSDEKFGLQRIKLEDRLPVGFDLLDDNERKRIITKIVEQDIKIKGELERRLMKSKNAEHDLAVLTDTINRLDKEKKIFSIQNDFETGSGNIKVHIRGGDTKFIVPILIVIGFIIFGILAILSSR
jgi:hypothetical protein